MADGGKCQTSQWPRAPWRHSNACHGWRATTDVFRTQSVLRTLYGCPQDDQAIRLVSCRDFPRRFLSAARTQMMSIDASGALLRRWSGRERRQRVRDAEEADARVQLEGSSAR